MLSYAGREVLIKSVISSIPSFTMLHYKIPKQIYSRIDGVIRKFWWNHEQENKHNLCPIAWDKICMPKMEGGLGFRRLEHFNEALMGKLAWAMITKESKTWVTLFTLKYCSKSKFMDLGDPSNHASHIWKGILRARNSLIQGCCFIIGNGNKTLATDPWIPNLDGFKPQITNANMDVSTKVSHFINSATKSWDLNMLGSCFNADAISEILKIRIPMYLPEDKLRWIKNQNGIYSVKSGYLTNLPNMNQIDDVTKETCKLIWKQKFHNRGALLTKVNLNKRIASIDKICPLCDTEAETEVHIFWECSFSRVMWFKRWCFRADHICLTTKVDLIKFVIKGHKNPSKTANLVDVQSWALAFLEKTWQVRNKTIFEPSFKLDLYNFSIDVERRAMEIESTYTAIPCIEPRFASISLPLPQGWLRFSCDAALNGMLSVVAGVVQNEYKEIIDQFAKIVHSTNPLVAETIAIFEATSYAKEKGWNKVSFESDSLITINAIIVGKGNLNWEIDGIVFDIRTLSEDFTNWSLKKIARTDNSLAHNAAQAFIKSLPQPNVLTSVL